MRPSWIRRGITDKEIPTGFAYPCSFHARVHPRADPVAGYWDEIIGPGKAIDTNKYYVLSSDTMVNLNAKMANVVTTGPASINPDTGKPYGMSFRTASIESSRWWPLPAPSRF